MATSKFDSNSNSNLDPNYDSAQNYNYSDNYQGQGQGGYSYNNPFYQLMINMNYKIDTMLQNQVDMNKQISGLHKTVAETTKRQEELAESMKEVKGEIKILRKENDNLRNKLEVSERKSLLQNIRIFRFPGGEKRPEETKEDVLSFVKGKLNMNINDIEINRTRWVGPSNARHVLVEFLHWQTKQAVMANLKNLKNLDPSDPAAKVSINHDLTQNEMVNKKANLPKFRELKKWAKDGEVELRRGTIFYNRKKQQTQEIDDLLSKLKQDAQMEHQPIPAGEHPQG